MSQKLNQPPRFAHLPKDAYRGLTNGLEHYARKAAETDYCKTCITATVQGKVLAYSMKRWGRAVCFRCQQKERDGDK